MGNNKKNLMKEVKKNAKCKIRVPLGRTSCTLAWGAWGLCFYIYWLIDWLCALDGEGFWYVASGPMVRSSYKTGDRILHQIHDWIRSGCFFTTSCLWWVFFSLLHIVVPKPNGTSSRDGEFGLSIYLLVGFLALLLSIASNTTLTAQPSNIFSHKPNPYPSLFLSCYLTPFRVCQPLSPLPPFLFIVSPWWGPKWLLLHLSHLAPTSAHNSL